jgi:hypothetical protein
MSDRSNDGTSRSQVSIPNRNSRFETLVGLLVPTPVAFAMFFGWITHLGKAFLIIFL